MRRLTLGVLAAAAVSFGWTATISTQPVCLLAGDVSGDCETDIVELQDCISCALGLLAATPCQETNVVDGECDIVELQNCINAALGLIPVCCDGVVNQATEECDPPDDAACPGLCQVDCTCPPPCGNGQCGSGETCANCPQDCGACCGNGVIDAGEECDPPQDAACPGKCRPDCTCEVCGDGQCRSGETCASCPQDCGACCGNGVVDAGEECDPPQVAACQGKKCLDDCTCSPCETPAITSVTPTSGPVGTEVTITGANFDCGSTRSLSCGGVSAVITHLSGTEMKSFIPLGAQDCLFSLATEGGVATAPEESGFDVVLSRDFSLTVAPTDSTVIQGSSTSYRVSAGGTDGFSDVITLGVTGLPACVSGSFSPGAITAGQSAMLIIRATDCATPSSVSVTVTGTASIDASEERRNVLADLTVAEKGRTALVGRVLDTSGLPIKEVAIRVGAETAFTDDNGNFLLQDPPAGDQVVLIDGEPASTPDTPYPTIPISMTIVAGETNELPYCPHLHAQKSFNFTAIDPGQDTVATDPAMPEVALRIPAGAQIIGWDGQPNEKVSMRTVPVGSLPVLPPPPDVSAKTVYMFYFGKQGGGTPTRPIPFVAPNDLGLAPGEKADLWYFDESPNPGEAPNDWRIAGTGTVSADGKTIVTDPGVGIPRFCCGAAAWNPRRPTTPQEPGETPEEGQGTSGGDPVDLSTGILMFTATDMVLPGRIPVAITRTYRSGDSFPGPFGIGTTMSYDDYIQQTSAETLTYVYRGNARTQFFRQPDGSYATNTVPAFRGARVTVGTDGTRTLRHKDGTALVFNSRGLPVKIRDRNGNEVVIKREVEFNPTEIIEPAGRSLRVTWQIQARDRATSVTDPIGRTVRYEYDGQNRLVRVINPEGGVTSYTYDDQHRMTSITDPRGITYLRNAYDVNSRVCEQEQADGGKFEFYYVTSDQSTSPESMQLLDEATAGGPISMPPCSAQPTLGIVVATVVVDPLGHPTTYRFNGSGYVMSITDALGQTTVMEREEGTNLQVATTDPLQRTTRFTYDEFGNVLSITDPANNVRRFEYDTTLNRLTKLTDPLGNVTTFQYDPRGNLVAITDPEQNLRPAPGRLKTQITYNQFGQPVVVTDPLGNSTRSTYDAWGNPAATSDPLGNTTRAYYDDVSRLISLTDPRGRTASFTFDVLDRITETRDALGGKTKFTYDENGNVLSVTDALDHTTTYQYDSMDRLIERTDPLGAFETFEYDFLGNLVRHTDRKQQLSEFTYDALNRQVGGSYADGTRTWFLYDTVGRVVQAGDSVGGDILRSYNALDHLEQETAGLGTVTYTYDTLGRRATLNVLGQDLVTYEYDTNSRLTRIAQGTHVVEFTYDALGRRTRVTLPNGVTTEYRYDAASRVTELVYRNARGILGNLTYAYDQAGNRQQVEGAFARTLLPDLVAQTAYDAANRQLRFGNQQMIFDPSGSLSSLTEPGGVTSFSWDPQNRLASLASPLTSVAFTYDAFGRRVTKTTGGHVVSYMYDGVDSVLQMSGGERISSLRSPAVDELLVWNDEDYVLADASRSTVALTDRRGEITARYTYEPFGRTVMSGRSTSPFQYAGRENDNSGLYYYRARYYSPQVGRFISEDPRRFESGDVNLYAYAGNNPTTFTDALGEKKDCKVDDRVGPLGYGGCCSGLFTAWDLGPRMTESDDCSGRPASDVKGCSQQQQACWRHDHCLAGCRKGWGAVLDACVMNCHWNLCLESTHPSVQQFGCFMAGLGAEGRVGPAIEFYKEKLREHRGRTPRRLGQGSYMPYVPDPLSRGGPHFFPPPFL